MYNNPFLYQNIARPSLFSRLFGGSSILGGAARSGINWGNLLSNTQKSLGIINQAIPLVHQAKPIINNAKTMFKIVGAMKEDTNSNINTKPTTNSTPQSTSTSTEQNSNKPIFYI